MSQRKNLPPPSADSMPQLSNRRRAVDGAFGDQGRIGPTRLVRPDQVAPNPANPREDVDAEALAELAASMGELGQIQAATVMTRGAYLHLIPEHDAEVGSAEYVVVSGSMRLMAARRAELDDFLIHVHDAFTSREQILEFALVENIQRQKLSPLDEARAVQNLVKVHGSGQAVAARLGKSPGWVSQKLALLDLTPELKKKLVSGELPARVGRKLGRLPAEKQADEWQRVKEPSASEPSETDGAAKPPVPSPAPAPATTPAAAAKENAPAQQKQPGRPQQLTLELEWRQPKETAEQLLVQLGPERFAQLREAMGQMG